MDRPNYIISSVAKSLTALKQFSSKNPEWGLVDLARQCGINKSSMLRILTTLESEGFVRKNLAGKYELGLEIFHLSNTSFGFINIKKICEPFLRDACDQSGLLVHLAIVNDGSVLVIDRLWPRQNFEAIALASKVGGTVPVHCTGVGKVLAAYSEPEQRNRLVTNCSYTKFSDRTITDKDEFLKALVEVKSKGFAINEGEHETYLKCLTRPIFDRDGKIIAAFSLSGLRDVLKGEQMEFFEEISRETARKINHEFGYLTYDSYQNNKL